MVGICQTAAAAAAAAAADDVAGYETIGVASIRVDARYADCDVFVAEKNVDGVVLVSLLRAVVCDAAAPAVSTHITCKLGTG